MDRRRPTACSSPARACCSRPLTSLQSQVEFSIFFLLVAASLLLLILPPPLSSSSHRRCLCSGLKPQAVLQSSFDMLSEMVKFNPEILLDISAHCTESQLEHIISTATGDMIASNVFLRSLILLFESLQSTPPSAESPSVFTAARRLPDPSLVDPRVFTCTAFRVFHKFLSSTANQVCILFVRLSISLSLT